MTEWMVGQTNRRTDKRLALEEVWYVWLHFEGSGEKRSRATLRV